ncbi:hypothetical protein A3Q56_07470 [Intoshia linei]|uniref:DZANK-type domain-containing protein n=1 Tax=Intoshia linei TaxID=1819745 RepID=A0A177ASM4_9BILA|nr:hypothetical protein A3Q56_07470 [Intoshia linei]
MTAGSVHVPTILPLRNPNSLFPKFVIDTNTRIALKTDTPNTNIYYTVNGFNPQIFDIYSQEAKNTYLYVEPFTLQEGKILIKAVAIEKNDKVQSNTVTKKFHVIAAPSGEDMINITKTENKLIVNPSRKNLIKITRNMVSCVEAWRDLNQTMIDKEYINTDEKSTLDFNKTKDFVENSYSYYKTNDYDYNTNVDNRQMLADNDKNLQNITRCDECFAIVSTNTMKCLVCEKIIHDNYTKEQDNHICVNCGAVNPITVSSCLICEEKILKKRKELYPCKTVKPIDRINCVSCNRTLNISAKYCDWCGIEHI